MSQAVEKLLEKLIKEIKYLGNGDAGTPMGALEAHGMMVEKAGGLTEHGLMCLADKLSEAIEDHAQAIRELGDDFRSIAHVFEKKMGVDPEV